MADDDTTLIYSADLDNKAVLVKIDEMRKKAKEFESEGSAAMVDYGKKIAKTADIVDGLSISLDGFGKLGKGAGEALSLIFNQNITTSKQLRAALAGMIKDLEAVKALRLEDTSVDLGKAGQGFTGSETRKIILEIVGEEEANSKIASLRETTEALLTSTDDRMKIVGAGIKALGESFLESGQKGEMSWQQVNSELVKLTTRAKAFKSELKTLSETTVEPLKTANLVKKFDDISAKASMMMASPHQSVKDFGRLIFNSLDEIEAKWGEQPDDIEAVSKAINGVYTQVTQYEGGLKSAEQAAIKLRQAQEKDVQQKAVEPLKFENVLKDMEELKQKATEFTNSATVEGKRFGKQMTQSLNEVQEAFQKDQISVDTLAGTLSKLTSETNKFEKSVSIASTEMVALDKRLNAHQAAIAVKELDAQIKRLMDSTEAEAKDAAGTFIALRYQIQKALQDPKADAVALTKKMQDLTQQAKKVGDAYEKDVAKGASGASVSAYKLGTTLDRVGLRGAGGILRIVDAFRGIPKSTALAIGALAGVGLAVIGVVKVIVALEKAMIKAFANVVKESINVAKTFELTEAQLENVFKGKADIARHTLDRILDLSVDFGVDLTGEFSKIFLPLVANFDQFEQIAKQASTLAIGTGATVDQISRALKQAQAGRFRSLQDQFGVLASDVDKIKRLQDELGETEGLIAGMDAFFERTGQNWDTYEDTLGRVLGSLDVLKNKLLLAFGEPIKNEVTDQLKNIIAWVEKNEQALKLFLSRVSAVVSDVFSFAGEKIQDFLDSITTEDMAEIESAISDVAYSAKQLIEAVTGAGPGEQDGFKFILRAAITLLKILEGTLNIVTDIVYALEKVKNLGGDIDKQAAYSAGVLSRQLERAGKTIEDIDLAEEMGINISTATRNDMRWMLGVLKELGLTTKEAVEYMERLGFAPEALPQSIDMLSAELEVELAAIEASEIAMEKKGDAILETNAKTQKFMITQEEYLAQVEEVRAAEKALNEEMQKRFSEIFTATMAADIEGRIAEVAKRIRIEQEKISRLEGIEWQIINIDAFDIDAGVQMGHMQIAGLQGEIDETLEYITNKQGQISEEELKRLQMQIEFKRKLIQLEQQHIDKLVELQTKRAQAEEDAQIEYDRRGEEILLKSHRAEIELELDHSRKIERMEQAHINRLREIRMRADFDAQEAIRMNDAVALLRIRRRMELDIKLANIKNDTQKNDAEVDAQDKRDKLNRQLQYELDDLETANDQKLEDIHLNFKRQLMLIEENYQQQLRDQATFEKQKQEDMLIWLKTELEDFKSMWDEKNAAHADKWKDFYDIETKYIQMIMAQRNQLYTYNPASIGPWASGLGYPTGQNLTQTTGGVANLLGIPGAPGNNPSFPNYGAPSSGGGGSAQSSVDLTLKMAVLQLLQRLNNNGQISNPQFWVDKINEATTNEALRAIQNLLRTIGVSGAPMQHGGYANPGHDYTVGEMGPEPFRPTKAGVIQPTQREYMPMGSPQIQHISTDNSRSITAPISMSDPSQLSPIQITVIRSIITEEILKSTV